MDVLPRQSADAVANMAADLLLLEKYPRQNAVRFRAYAWSVPACTFGVSQSWEKYRAVVPAGCQLVRRCTGGGLVSHLEDWTFALVIPASHPLAGSDAMSTYALVHRAMLEALSAQGQQVALSPEPKGARDYRQPDDCAARAEPNDLVRPGDGRKVAGAAQKRTKQGLLIEGYVWRPFLPDCDWVRFEKEFPEALGRALSSPPVPVPEPIYDQFDHEGAWAKFNSAEWNRRI
ncbi:MAG: lipoyl protein ligase domain-containing protein [Opitutales bacterium]